MTQFNEREKGFEAKFSHDQEHDFRAKSRRNKMLGMWVAEQLGLSGDEAMAYALTVVDADFERPGDGDVIEKVVTDLTEADIGTSEHIVRKKMDELYAQARKEIAGA